MEPINTIQGVEEYLATKKPRVLLDTNILIKGCDGKPIERKLIQKLCAHMDIFVSDTVYWEFLRNTNLESFRERRSYLAKWPNGDFLREEAILRESIEVKTMHSRLFALLLWLHSKELHKVVKLLTPDLWIAAAAISSKADHILTTNTSDFSEKLFSKVACIKDGELKVYLLTFQREHIKHTWLMLRSEPSFQVHIQSCL